MLLLKFVSGQVSNGTFRILHRWKGLAREDAQVTSCFSYEQCFSLLIIIPVSAEFSTHFQSFSADNLHQESCENQKSGSYSEHLGMSEDASG
jgi:hypothetical protein